MWNEKKKNYINIYYNMVMVEFFINKKSMCIRITIKLL